MLKRLIEVALPLKEVSEQSAREKSIRHGHISTLHIWWARRPLAACRAAVFASLIPDPDDPECPEDFRRLVREVLGRRIEFRPKSEENGTPIADTPRTRCLEFIKHLVRWENSNNPEYIEPARKLIAAAHKILHPGAEGNAPKLLDPFAGGGAIPLEALRLGCEAHAIDLNPVAHLIETCTLVYPQTFGQPNSRPIPHYIRSLIARNRTTGKGKDGASLFDKEDASIAVENEEILPISLTEADYLKNPLAADVRYWGHWVLEKARRELGRFYPDGEDGAKRLAYLWANTLPCPNPRCGATVPLAKQFWLAKTPKKRVWLKMIPRGKTVQFEIVNGTPQGYDPSIGTIQLGAMQCPVCGQGSYDKNQIKSVAREKGLGHQPLCSVSTVKGQTRLYKLLTVSDKKAFEDATKACEELMLKQADGMPVLPVEAVGRDYEWVLKPPMFGLHRWCDQHNPRQLLALSVFAKHIRSIPTLIGGEYGKAVAAMMTLVLGRLADRSAKQCRWHVTGEKLEGVFGRQAIPMSWDYVPTDSASLRLFRQIIAQPTSSRTDSASLRL